MKTTVILNPLRIEQLAAKKGWPKKALAIELDMGYQSLVNMLNRQRVTPHSACRIANALDVDVEEIITNRLVDTSVVSKRGTRGTHSFAFDMKTIYALMGSLNMNGSDLAYECGVSRQRINQIFKRGRCSMSTLCMISNALGCDCEHLLVPGGAAW